MPENRMNRGGGGSRVELPWSVPPALAEKPHGMRYGYVSMDPERRQPVLHECNHEELEEKVGSGEALEVVVPEYKNLAPPSIVEGLWPAVQKRERSRREKERQNAIFNVCLFGGITIYSIKSADSAWQIVLMMFVLFGLVPLVQYLIGAVRRRLKGEETFEEMKERTLFAFWLGAGEVPATRWCVRGLVAVFAVQVLAPAFNSQNLIGSTLQFLFVVSPQSIEAGALVKPLVREGEAWRLVTCGLLHGGLLHIGFNAMAFLNVGAVLERFYGRAILLLTFFLSVLGGSLASQFLMPETSSLGASGGIMGLVGFLLVIGLRYRGELPADFAKSIVRSVLFMAALGFLAKDYIDNAAHAGGFLVGCLIALPLVLHGDVRDLGRYNERSWLRACGWAAAGILGLSAAWVVLRLLAVSGIVGS
ncbi:MAG: rhomboid family intramembrane serine protease [Verrucomicrobiales bacterium]